ncbi:MAG: hypothetical protein HKM28_00200 [Flavobacteriaceae bacterium]|nr:hypothetical protein [Flavobacteriaceae bacterium]
MMILKFLSADKQLLADMSDFLLQERLIAQAMLGSPISVTEKSKSGKRVTTDQYELKGISKSLLFNRINEVLKKRYKERLPLMYSEPIILIDEVHRQSILDRLVKI